MPEPLFRFSAGITAATPRGGSPEPVLPRRRGRGVDRALVASLVLSLLLHAAVLTVVPSLLRGERDHVFLLVEAGEEALEVAIGAAFESAAFSPPPPETRERRFEETPPPPPETPEERERPAGDRLFAPTNALASLALPQRVASETREETLTRPRHRRYHDRAAEPEAMEPRPPQPPAPASAAASVGGNRSARGVRQRARPNGALVPRYPQGSRRRGETGEVTIRAFIDAAGRCAWARVEASSGYPELDNAAVDTVRRASFQPAREEGVAVTTEERFLIEFRLR